MFYITSLTYSAQLAFVCSKSTVETLEKVSRFVQS